MNEQDIINLILGEPEDDFHGTVPSKDKRLRFDRLRGHAGALMHYTHGNLDIQEPLETRRSACGRNEGGTWLAGDVLHLRPSGVI